MGVRDAILHLGVVGENSGERVPKDRDAVKVSGTLLELGDLVERLLRVMSQPTAVLASFGQTRTYA
jgi:hypothetical protein